MGNENTGSHKKKMAGQSKAQKSQRQRAKSMVLKSFMKFKLNKMRRKQSADRAAKRANIALTVTSNATALESVSEAAGAVQPSCPEPERSSWNRVKRAVRDLNLGSANEFEITPKDLPGHVIESIIMLSPREFLRSGEVFDNDTVKLGYKLRFTDNGWVALPLAACNAMRFTETLVWTAI